MPWGNASAGLKLVKTNSRKGPPEISEPGPLFNLKLTGEARTENRVKNHFQDEYKEASTLLELNTHPHQDPVASASNSEFKWKCCLAIATSGGQMLLDWAKEQDFVKNAVASVTSSPPIMMAGGLAVLGGAIALDLTGLLRGERGLDIEDIKKAMRECLKDHDREKLIESVDWVSNQVCRHIPGITFGDDRFAAWNRIQQELDKIRSEMETHLKENTWEPKHARLFEAWSHIVDLRLMVLLNMTQIMNHDGIPRYQVNTYEAQRKLHEDTLQDLHLKYMVYRISMLEMLTSTQMIIDRHTERYIHMQGNTKIYENAPGQIIQGKVADLLEVYIRCVASDAALWLRGTKIRYWPAFYVSKLTGVVKSKKFVYYMPKIYQFRGHAQDFVSNGAFAVKWYEGEKPQILHGNVYMKPSDETRANKVFCQHHCTQSAVRLAEAEAARALAEAEAARALAEAEAARALAEAEADSTPRPGSTSTPPPLVPHCSAELNGHSARARVCSSRHSATARVLLFLLLSSAILKCLWPQLKQRL